MKSQAQYNSQISEIGSSPEGYYASNVLLRMIEGAGFRYYWATEGLGQSDFDFKPCETCRSSSETLRHIYGLSEMVRTTVMGETFTGGQLKDEYNSQKVIELTNANWANMANYLTEERLDLSELAIRFEGRGEVPFWNLLNGPLADAIYHTGQIVSQRRQSGNPINSKVNVFMGRLND